MDFYWTTYQNERINGLHTKKLNLDSEQLIVYPVSLKQDVNYVE